MSTQLTNQTAQDPYLALVVRVFLLSLLRLVFTRLEFSSPGFRHDASLIPFRWQIDPTRTCAAGKVELGAFRTYPKGFKPPDEGPSEYQSIPLEKIEDFGVHCKQ